MYGHVVDWVAGGIVGALIAIAIPWLTKAMTTVRVRKGTARRQRATDNTRVYQWLGDYYDRRGHGPDLYTCSFPTAHKQIPFLTQPAWLAPDDLAESDATAIVKVQSRTPTEYPIDDKLLRRRRRIGQRLFDGPAVSLSGVELTTNDQALYVTPCRYFAVASSIIAIEEETFRAASKKRRPKTPLRDRYLPSAEQAARLELQPRSLGCAFLLAFRSGDSYELLLHKRSRETVSFGDTRAVIPNFGLEAIGLGRNGPVDLLTLNFVKEYLEELFDYEELMSVMSSRRADPTWFMDLPEAQRICALREEKDFRIVRLGFGFDALNGNGILAMLGVFEDPQIAEQIRETLELNWEVASSTADGLAIDWVRIDADQLDQWLLANELHPGAAFAIDRALVHLRTRLVA